MTDTLTRPAPRQVTPAGTIPLARLTRVELRKLVDTRAGAWLLAVTALAAVATSLIELFFVHDSDQTFSGFLEFGLVPASYLLPVLGILSMTGEWSQRTALTTFTLTPARGRVITAKLLGGVLIALATTVVTAGLCALANVIGHSLGGDGSWAGASDLIWHSAVAQVLYVLMGLGFGALLLNSPFAIVAFLVLPNLWAVLGGTIHALHRVDGWLDLSTTMGALGDGHTTAEQFARIGVSAAVWILLPLVAGSIRVLRREVS
jgi:ABC-2 type transport system permease protein